MSHISDTAVQKVYDVARLATTITILTAFPSKNVTILRQLLACSVALSTHVYNNAQFTYFLSLKMRMRNRFPKNKKSPDLCNNLARALSLLAVPGQHSTRSHQPKTYFTRTSAKVSRHSFPSRSTTGHQIHYNLLLYWIAGQTLRNPASPIQSSVFWY